MKNDDDTDDGAIYSHRWGGAPLICLKCKAFYGFGSGSKCPMPDNEID